MKFKDLLSLREMSLPAVNSDESAVEILKDAYKAIVVRKQPHGDYYGRVEAALRWFEKESPNPEKYTREVKMGQKAKAAMDRYKSVKSTAQAKFTTAK